MDDKTFDELLASLKEATRIIKLFRVARAAKEFAKAVSMRKNITLIEQIALDDLWDALKEVEGLL